MKSCSFTSRVCRITSIGGGIVSAERLSESSLVLVWRLFDKLIGFVKTDAFLLPELKSVWIC
jgi:hypothetical protein